MKTKVILEGIEVYSFHGHLKEERKIGGKYRVDLSFVYDASKAEKSDLLKDAINYERVFQIVQEQMKKPSKLLEHLAQKVMSVLVTEFNGVEEVNLTIAKLHPPLPGIMKSVSVELNYKK